MIQDAADRSLSSAFLLALVLTNEVDQAESIVGTAIESLPREAFSEAALLAEVASTAWKQTGIVGQGLGQRNAGGVTSLPEELESVFDLPKPLRYCFSIRTLAGLSAQVCGRLIGLRPDQVNYLVALSVRALAKAATSRTSIVIGSPLTRQRGIIYDEFISRG